MMMGVIQNLFACSYAAKIGIDSEENYWRADKYRRKFEPYGRKSLKELSELERRFLLIMHRL